MGWTGLPATNATDWSAVGFLQQFIDAVNERWLTFRNSEPTVFPDVQIGDDVSDGNPTGFIASLQSRLELMATRFIDPEAVDFSQTDLSDWKYHITEWRQAAGFTLDGERTISNVTDFGRPGWLARRIADAQIYEYGDGVNGWRWYVAADQGQPPDPVSTGFTRKYPREIDDAGDAGESGWIARHRYSGAIYIHDGSAWSLAGDQLQSPDVITACGMIQSGDYIGPWIWNQLHAGLNLLHTRAFWSWTDGGSPVDFALGWVQVACPHSWYQLL